MADGEKTNNNLKYMKPREIFLNKFSPHTGAQTRMVPLNEAQRKGTILRDFEKVKAIWEKHYQSSEHICSHAYWAGRCHVKIGGEECDHGMRRRKYTVGIQVGHFGIHCVEW